MINKILIFLLMFSSVFSIDTNCNKLWGMNNEINGVTVSKIGVYMCVEDPLNIYKNAFTTQNPVNSELILNENNFDINNFNSSIQDILNNSNVSNIISNFSIVKNTSNIVNTTNITYIPEFNPNSTITDLPTTTMAATTTTSTTSNIQTTTTIPTTTIPITTQATITTQSMNDNKNITQFNKSVHYDTLISNNEQKYIDPENKNDNTAVILITIFSTITCLCCCTVCYLKKKKSKVIENDIPQLRLPDVRKRFSKSVVPTKTKKNLNSLKAPPIPKLPPPGLPVPTLNNGSFTINVNPNKPLTPVNNRRLKFSEKFSDKEVASVTTPKTHEWYKQTFADEINDLQETFSPRQKQNHTHTKVKTIDFQRNPPARKKIDKRQFNVNPSKHISPDNRGNFKNPAFRNKRLNSWNNKP